MDLQECFSTYKKLDYLPKNENPIVAFRLWNPEVYRGLIRTYLHQVLITDAAIYAAFLQKRFRDWDSLSDQYYVDYIVLEKDSARISFGDISVFNHNKDGNLCSITLKNGDVFALPFEKEQAQEFSKLLLVLKEHDVSIVLSEYGL